MTVVNRWLFGRSAQLFARLFARRARRRHAWPTLLLPSVLTLCLTGWLIGQERQQRAVLPTWPELPPGIFFENAFEQGLRGTRPESFQSVPSSRQQSSADRFSANAPSANLGSDQAGTSGTGGDWSRLISASSIEDELKAIKRLSDDALRSEGYFKGQGYREIRQHLGTAAILFAIIDQYPGSVRWKQYAPTARQQFARVAQNTKAGSSQAYREANARRQDLGELIRGGTIEEQPVEEWTWPSIADRKLVMQRLELAHQERLGPAVSSANQLAEQQATVVREAELVAALAQVLMQEGMDDAADDDYRQFCEELLKAAKAMAEAAQSDRYDAARDAQSEIKNSCVSCHELYRA